MIKIVTYICLIVLNSAAAFAVEAKPAGSTSELDSKQKLFIEEYVKAVNSGNLDKLKSLSHPKCMSCMNEENKEFYDDQFSDLLKKNIQNNYNIYIKEVKVDEKLPFTKVYSYPVKPTHLIQINYEVRKNYGMSLMIFVRNQNDQYFKVLPCPKPEVMEKYREGKIRKEKQKIRAKELFLKLKDPLLSDLKTLLHRDRIIEAIKEI